MSTTQQLTSSRRELLSTVYEAAFANPFSLDRSRLDMNIAGLGEKSEPDERLAAAISRVNNFITGLGNFSLNSFAADDRKLVKHALLFSLFHNCIPRMDKLISRQIETGDGSCPVPFAANTIGHMTRVGINDSEAAKFFALFYQLRRGYRFISTSLVGRSSSMRRLRVSLWNNVFTVTPALYADILWNRMEDFSSLILGETGTGKGAAAAAIGRSGFIPFDTRKNCFQESFTSAFVEINLSQFPESLIESELFGHRRGAFTGAVEAHKGVFSMCSPCGAVFLDEIGDVSIPVQTKLLRVLQERTFSPVGSHEKVRFHGRVIAATNKSIDKLRNSGLFRDDFYYRLCSDLIEMPPLRLRISENPHELDDLLQVVVTRISGIDDHRLTTHIKQSILDSVGISYAWPGNVRELEQCARRILLCGSYTGQNTSTNSAIAKLHAGIDSAKYDTQTQLSDYCKHLYAIHGTYEAVAKISGLDRRTAKKYITMP